MNEDTRSEMDKLMGNDSNTSDEADTVVNKTDNTTEIEKESKIDYSDEKYDPTVNEDDNKAVFDNTLVEIELLLTGPKMSYTGLVDAIQELITEARRG